MLAKRIIPCLDVQDGRVVKGVCFEDLRDVGDPVALGTKYAESGADELCFLNITASRNDEAITFELVREISRSLFIPFTVGGGIRSVEDARRMLRAGADKVALNTAALTAPLLLTELADEFGRQCVVLSIDARRSGNEWYVTTHSATRTRGQTCVEWAVEAVERGAGEILLNAIDTDGVCGGFSLDVTQAVSAAVSVPVIASGGAGSVEDFVDVFRKTEASAALAASIFHSGEWTPDSLKLRLGAEGIEVRL